jgi:L-lactate dehydrogenase complex protein LldF
MIRVGEAAHAPSFRDAAKRSLANTQLRQNVRRATDTIRGKRAALVGEVPDWQELRDAAQGIKQHTLRYLDVYLEQFEDNCVRGGGQLHWARDADEANLIVIDLIQKRRETEVIKVKTMTSDETQLNVALEAAGIPPYETGLAGMIIQLRRQALAHRRSRPSAKKRDRELF